MDECDEWGGEGGGFGSRRNRNWDNGLTGRLYVNERRETLCGKESLRLDYRNLLS